MLPFIMLAAMASKGVLDAQAQSAASSSAEKAQAEQRKQDASFNLQSLLAGGGPQRFSPIQPIPTVNYSGIIPGFGEMAGAYQMNEASKNTEFGQQLKTDRFDIEKLYREALINQANASTSLTQAKVANPELYRTPSIYDLMLQGNGLNLGGGMGAQQQPNTQTGPVFGGFNPTR